MLPDLADLTLIYAVLTPTFVLYAHTTTLLLDRWLSNSQVQLIVGFASAVAFAYFHDVFRRNVPTRSSQLVTCYETAYDYTVKLSCWCYYLGCRTIYPTMLKAAVQPVYVAITAAVILISLRGFRNVLSLPVVVHNDASVERYRPLSTLTFTAGIELRCQCR